MGESCKACPVLPSDQLSLIRTGITAYQHLEQYTGPTLGFYKKRKKRTAKNHHITDMKNNWSVWQHFN